LLKKFSVRARMKGSVMAMNGIKEKWAGLHKQPRCRPQYSSESVVTFLFTSFPSDFEERRNLKILDIGCGSGRHVKLFAEQGFDVYGTDFSKEGDKTNR